MNGPNKACVQIFVQNNNACRVRRASLHCGSQRMPAHIELIADISYSTSCHFDLFCNFLA